MGREPATRGRNRALVLEEEKEGGHNALGGC